MIRYSVIGAVGYVCGELLRMMVAHPEGKLVNVLDTFGVGDRICDYHPHLRGFYDQQILDINEENVRATAAESDVVFVQVPSGSVAQWAEIVLAAGKKCLKALVGKCLPQGALADIVRAVDAANVDAMKRLTASSSGKSIHKAVLLFTRLNAELMVSSGAEAALADAGESAPAWLALLSRAAAALARRDALVARAELAGVPEDDPAAWPALRLLLLCELFTSGTGETHAEAVLRFRPRDFLAHYVLGNRANTVDHDPAAAIAHLQASVAERPTWMALNDLASLLAEHGDPRLGEAMARDALRITHGTMPSIHDTLGETLMAQKRAEDAADAFRAALRGAEAQPGSPTAVFHLHLAEALFASGDALGALDELSAADARVSELGDDVASVLRLENLRRRAEAALPGDR